MTESYIDPHQQPLMDEPGETIGRHLKHWGYNEVPERYREFEIVEDIVVSMGRDVTEKLSNHWMGVTSAHELDGIILISHESNGKYLGVLAASPKVPPPYTSGIYRDIGLFAKMNAAGRVVEPGTVSYDSMAERLRECHQALAAKLEM